MKDMKEAKRSKANVGVGSVVTANVGETEKKNREGRIRIMGKEVTGCVGDVAGKNNFLVKFGDG